MNPYNKLKRCGWKCRVKSPVDSVWTKYAFQTAGAIDKSEVCFFVLHHSRKTGWSICVHTKTFGRIKPPVIASAFLRCITDATPKFYQHSELLRLRGIADFRFPW